MAPHRRCPTCRSDEIARSRTRNLLERMLKQVLRTAPYRCGDCGRRFFRRTKRMHLQKPGVRAGGM
jgi:predicted Zn-ribbon and HTH transcriptional regulator